MVANATANQKRSAIVTALQPMLIGKESTAYYALLVLAQTGLIGYIDPKVDRKANKLLIQRKSVSGSLHLAKSPREFAEFLSTEPA